MVAPACGSLLARAPVLTCTHGACRRVLSTRLHMTCRLSLKHCWQGHSCWACGAVAAFRRGAFLKTSDRMMEASRLEQQDFTRVGEGGVLGGGKGGDREGRRGAWLPGSSACGPEDCRLDLAGGPCSPVSEALNTEPDFLLRPTWVCVQAYGGLSRGCCPSQSPHP